MFYRIWFWKFEVCFYIKKKKRHFVSLYCPWLRQRRSQRLSVSSMLGRVTAQWPLCPTSPAAGPSQRVDSERLSVCKENRGKISYGMCFEIPLNRKNQQLEFSHRVRYFPCVSLNARETWTYKNVWKRFECEYNMQLITRSRITP